MNNEDQITGGATLWARQTIESDLFCKKPAVWFKIWFYLINRVNYKDSKQFKRGECFLKYEEIMRWTGATYNEITGFLRWSKSVKAVTTRQSKYGTHVIIANYSHFQTLDNYYIDVSVEAEMPSQLKLNQSSVKANKEKKGKNEKKNPINNCAKSPKIDMNKFDEWYALYPRKQGKGGAIKAWKKIKPIEYDEVIEGIRRQLPMFSETDAQFIPLPASWLNGLRWLDEIVVPISRKRLIG